VRRLVLVVFLLLLACGKRGDPHPPVPIIPKATSDLVVAQRGPSVFLSWSYPTLTTAGQKLGAIRRIVVQRYVEELPVTQPPRDLKTLLPGDVDTTLPTAVALFAKVPPISRTQFMRLAQRLDTLEAAKIPAATAGSRILYQDNPPLRTEDGRPVRIDYAVVTVGSSARSELSNIVTIVPIDVPQPPSALTAVAQAQGVVLTWKAPEKTITGAANPHVIGFDIYRITKGEKSDALAKPVNAAPIGETSYTDVPPYGDFEYWVSAVASGGPPRIESEGSDPAAVTFKDLLPPPPPSGLTALVETDAVRLVWDPVAAPDLAGYKIYRTEGTGIGALKEVGSFALTPQPIPQTNYRDTSVKHGISYYYSVSSIDKSGNESKPVKTDWVLVPRTPGVP